MAKRSERASLLQGLEATICPPVGVSARQWRGVRSLLIAIAKHYPRPYPSQATLAAETGYSVRAIRGYVAIAQEAGLLLVKADAGKKGKNNNWSKTNRYLITLAPVDDKHASTDEARCASKPYGLRPSGVELRSTTSSEVVSLSADDLPPGERARQVGKAPSEAPSKRPRPRPKPDELVVDSGRRQPKRQRSTPVKWAVATEHFGRAWQAMIERLPANDRLRKVRPVETRGHCRSYFDSHFFGPNALTPKTVEEVCALIDRFVADAYRRQAPIKDGQSAWMAFTGGWGRKPLTRQYHNTVRDYVPPPLEEQ